MRFPQMSTRRWMVVVLLAGLVAWAGTLRTAYRRRAAEHDQMQGRLSQQMTASALWREWERVRDDWVKGRSIAGRPYSEEAVLAHAQRLFGELQARYARRMLYHKAMAQKYRQAALRPWLPIAPDPPEPRSP